jgi:PAS domain S-box-containing protein
LEDRLQENQRNFEAIFQKSIFGNAIITTDLQINDVNGAFTQMLGYSPDQLTHKSILDFVHPDYLEDWQKLQLTIQEGKAGSFNMETMLVKSDNSLVTGTVGSHYFF